MMRFNLRNLILKHFGLMAEAERLAAWEKTLAEKEENLQNSEAASSNDVNNCAQQVFANFRDTQQMMDSLRLSIVELKDTIIQGNEQAVFELCQLCQDMESNASEEVQSAGFTLSEILKKHFEAVPFSPSNGRIFNPMHCERRDCSQKGKYITECYASGWKRFDKVLIKAVVDTAEKE